MNKYYDASKARARYQANKSKMIQHALNLYYAKKRKPLFDATDKGIVKRVFKQLRVLNINAYNELKQINEFQMYEKKLICSSKWKQNQKKCLSEVNFNTAYNRVRNRLSKILHGSELDAALNLMRNVKRKKEYKEALITIRYYRKELKDIKRKLQDINKQINKIGLEERKRAYWKVQTYNRNKMLCKGNGVSSKQWYGIMKEFGYACCYCGKTRKESRREGFDLEIDHIIPLTSKHGFHQIENVAPACKQCNSSKSNEDLSMWLKNKNFIPNELVMTKYKLMLAFVDYSNNI